MALTPKLNNEQLLAKWSAWGLIKRWKCTFIFSQIHPPVQLSKSTPPYSAVCSLLSDPLSLFLDIFAPLTFAPVCWERLRAGQEQMGCWQPSFTQLGWVGTWVGVLISTNKCVCACVRVVCVCKGHNRRNYLCLRGPVVGGHVGLGVVWRGGVQQWPNHRLCVYRAEGWQVSAIIDYLHTTTRACSRALNTEMHTLLLPLSLSPAFFLFVSPSNAHRLIHIRAARACLQCISVSVSLSVRERDGKAPASTSLWQKSGHRLLKATLQAKLCELLRREKRHKLLFTPHNS